MSTIFIYYSCYLTACSCLLYASIYAIYMYTHLISDMIIVEISDNK